ncbi:MAG: DegT/DnrJ/EryC1/StrS family aminotransferase [Pseudonocardiaceae bacterium]
MSGERWPLLHEAVAAMPAPFGSVQAEGLEEELKAAYGVSHAIGVSSGTAALHSALIGCRAGPGTEVLIPAFTVVMTVAAIVATGARPVFVDTHPDGFGLDLDDADAKRTAQTIALLPVHVGGRTGDLAAARDFTHHAGIRLVEDACQAQGSRWRSRPVGTVGDVGCFSMKDGKILSCGEGGYILTDDPLIAAGAAAFRTHWQTGTPAHPPGHRLGHNLRLAEPLAALARHSLATRDAALTRRREQTDLLTTLVGDLPGLAPIPATPGEDPNGYAALWRIERPRPRELCQRLAAAGVVNAIGTFGLRAAHTHPACQTLDPAACPRAEALINSLLSVPVTSADDDERIGQIAKLIRTEVTAWH